MPLALYFNPSFARSLKHLGSGQLRIIGLILEALGAYYASDCDLEGGRRIAPQFFYKQLRKPYYEAGVESNLRIILVRKKAKCIAVLAGNHDQIRKFLVNS